MINYLWKPYLCRFIGHFIINLFLHSLHWQVGLSYNHKILSFLQIWFMFLNIQNFQFFDWKDWNGLTLVRATTKHWMARQRFLNINWSGWKHWILCKFYVEMCPKIFLPNAQRFFRIHRFFRFCLLLVSESMLAIVDILTADRSIKEKFRHSWQVGEWLLVQSAHHRLDLSLKLTSAELTEVSWLMFIDESEAETSEDLVDLDDERSDREVDSVGDARGSLPYSAK